MDAKDVMLPKLTHKGQKEFSPAKINLFLHITGRTTRLHYLQTLFRLLAMGDTLTFLPYEQNQILVSGYVPSNTIPNTVEVAADLIAPYAKKVPRPGVHVHIHKHIPVGSGLGGGSSNAATVLLFLNHYWGCRLGNNDLVKVARNIGCDVPLFIVRRDCWGEGFGDKLTPVTLPQDQYYLIIVPNGLSVCTATQFEDKNIERNTPEVTYTDFLDGKTTNAFERSTLNRYPDIAEGFEWLGRYAKPHLSGSGGSFFSAFSTFEEANSIKADCPPKFLSFVATPFCASRYDTPYPPGETILGRRCPPRAFPVYQKLGGFCCGYNSE